MVDWIGLDWKGIRGRVGVGVGLSWRAGRPSVNSETPNAWCLRLRVPDRQVELALSLSLGGRHGK